MPTLVDTSSLIALVQFQRERKVFPWMARDLGHRYPAPDQGVDGIIEALTLHDELLFDGPSLKRNLDRYPELRDLIQLGDILWAEDETLEERVYSYVLDNYVPLIQAALPSAVHLLRGHTERWMSAEVGADPGFLSVPWPTLEDALEGNARALAKGLRDQFGEHCPRSGAALAVIMRTLYYNCVQLWTGSDLVLHPMKNLLLAGEFDIDRQSKSAKSAQALAISNLLGLFDGQVRRSFYERKDRWLGGQEVTFDVPMLTQYVLGERGEEEDLVGAISRVRRSKDARNFRESIRHLTDAARDRRNAEVESILLELSDAADGWSRDLLATGTKKTVTVSVPLIHVTTNFEVPVPRIRKRKVDGLLVFLHAVLRRS